MNEWQQFQKQLAQERPGWTATVVSVSTYEAICTSTNGTVIHRSGAYRSAAIAKYVLVTEAKKLRLIEPRPKTNPAQLNLFEMVQVAE